MGAGDKKVCECVVSFLEKNNLEYYVKEEPYCDHFYIKHGSLKADLNVYNTGKINIGGPASDLKKFLQDNKEALCTANFAKLTQPLSDIDKLPQIIKERIPECDEIIFTLFNEAVRAYGAKIFIGATFLVGAASEKAVSCLIDSFANAIVKDENKKAFKEKIGKKKAISVKYYEFIQSYKSCKTQCSDPSISNDLEIILDKMFDFYRMTRNDVGHPNISPDVNEIVLSINLSHFVHYLEKIYILISFFNGNEVIL